MLNKLKFILTEFEKKKFIILFIGILFLALLETFSIGIIIPIMSLFVNQEKIQASKTLQWFYQLTSSQDNIAFLTILIITAIILFFIKSLYGIFMLYHQKNFANNIRIRLTTKLLTSYLNRCYSFHLENNSAILFRNITTAVTQFCSNFLQSLLFISTDIVILLAISLLLISIYPMVTLLVGLMFAIVMILINLFLKKRIALYSSQRTEGSEQVHKFGLEALQGVKEIKVYNAQTFFVEKYSQVAKKYVNSVVKFDIASGLPRYALELILITSVLMLLLLSMHFHKSSSELIPMIMALGFAAVRVLPIIQRIYLNINIARYYSDGLDIVYRALQEDSSEEMLENDIKGYVSLPGESQAIRLENVEFRYKSAPSSILKEFNLIIPEHNTVAFVGETGAGKSTLIDILMGLLIPANGALYYGQVPINSNNVSEYRNKISYVPQHIFLIDDTLEANIAFGVPRDEIDQGRLEQVIRISQLRSFVNNLHEGLKTIVGEKGVRLSGGQRQRVAIARALYRNPEILIMDEATSALDGYTEAEVNRAIKNLCGKLTIILIAHRLSTIEYADIIYVMDGGRIVGQGSFEELLENSPTFKKIANQSSI